MGGLTKPALAWLGLEVGLQVGINEAAQFKENPCSSPALTLRKGCQPMHRLGAKWPEKPLVANGSGRACYSAGMSLRTINATRYVTPLREGGSLPAIVEAGDQGLYVLKFRGAGQGAKALIAELVCGELARAIGLPVPELVFVELDPDLARTEPDPEIQDLIKASAGLNIAMDYLPGSVMFDPVVDQPEGALASAIVWFDAYVTNVDRTVRNTNLLMWHRRLYLIDHGAALYFHHSWQNHLQRSQDRFAMVKNHVLLPFADQLAEVATQCTNRLTPDLISNIVEQIPDSWLQSDTTFDTAGEYRTAYAQYLQQRLTLPQAFVEEALSARSLLV